MKTQLSAEEKDILLALNNNPKIGAKTLQRILHHFKGNFFDLFNKNEADLVQLFGNVPGKAIHSSRNNLEIDKKIFGRYQIEPIFIGDESYPQLLAEIYDPPAILYCRGDIELLKKPSIAIVGSRKHSYYAKAVLEKIIPVLSNSKIVIVSGLALGVDGLAHYLALESGGETIGILGSGTDKVYPSSNQLLGERMIKNNGLIISEFPPETPPLKQNFPLRNRIIAGMTLGTLVVEARKESGSLITAAFAIDAGREVFAVPGNIDSFASEGCNWLIKEGAKIVTSAEDILEEIGIDNINSNIASSKPENDEEKMIFEILQKEKSDIDKIFKTTKIDISALNSLLAMMEISGKVEKLSDGRYRLK